MERRKAKRGRRVYVDVLQNARGHHAVPPYVLRAVPGAPVSTPLRWAELTADLAPRRCPLQPPCGVWLARASAGPGGSIAPNSRDVGRRHPSAGPRAALYGRRGAKRGEDVATQRLDRPGLVDGRHLNRDDVRAHLDERAVDLDEVLRTPDEALVDRFTGTPLRRPGAAGLKRNALLVLANLGDPDGIPSARLALSHPSPVVRGAAVWALSLLGDPLAHTHVDEDPLVREEVAAAMLSP